MKLRKYDPKRKAARRSPAQEWAQKRNWAKACLLGCRAQVSGMCTVMTPREWEMLQCTLYDIDSVIEFWKEESVMSKDMYLKRKEVK